MESFQCLISILFLFLAQQLGWCFLENHTGAQQRWKKEFSTFKVLWLQKNLTLFAIILDVSFLPLICLFQLFNMFYSISAVAEILLNTPHSQCLFPNTLLIQLGIILSRNCPPTQLHRMLSGAILWRKSYVLVLLLHQSFSLSISLRSLSVKHVDKP